MSTVTLYIVASIFALLGVAYIYLAFQWCIDDRTLDQGARFATGVAYGVTAFALFYYHCPRWSWWAVGGCLGGVLLIQVAKCAIQSMLEKRRTPGKRGTTPKNPSTGQKAATAHSSSHESDKVYRKKIKRRMVPLNETSERWSMATVLYQETRQRLVPGTWSKADAYPVFDGFRAMSADEIFALVERLNAAEASAQNVRVTVENIEDEVKEIVRQATGETVPVSVQEKQRGDAGGESERWSRALAGMEMIHRMDRNHFRNDAKGAELLRRMVAQCKDPHIVARAKKLLNESTT